MASQGQPVAPDDATPKGVRIFAVSLATVVFFVLYLVLMGVLAVVSRVGDPGKLIFAFWIIGSYVAGAVAYFAAHFLATGIARDHSKNLLSTLIFVPLFIGLVLAVLRFFLGGRMGDADYWATVALMLMFGVSLAGVTSMQRYLD